MSTATKKALKIKDLFTDLVGIAKDTRSHAASAEGETKRATSAIQQVKTLVEGVSLSATAARKLMRWVVFLAVLDLGAIGILGYRQTKQLEEANVELQKTLQQNGEALSTMATAVNNVSAKYDTLNSYLGSYVPGYTKYLYYNQETGMVEVYNLAQARKTSKVGTPEAVPVADLDTYLRTLRKHKAQPSK